VVEAEGLALVEGDDLAVGGPGAAPVGLVVVLLLVVFPRPDVLGDGRGLGITEVLDVVVEVDGALDGVLDRAGRVLGE
jgi:hypothetical protein